MNVSERDKKILMMIIPLVVVLGYWFMLLAPQRNAAAEAGKQLASEQTRLVEAQSRASTVQAAKASFADDYAAVVALGKAIPTSVDMPSLLVQLEQAARGTGIEFDGVTVGERGAATGGAAPAAPAPTGTPGAPDPSGAAPTAPSGQPAQSAPGAAVGSAQQAADAATTPPSTDPAAAGTAADPGDPAAAGAAPGSALEQVSLEFTFKGDFFALADFFHSLKRFVFVDGDKVRVRGRLMTINSVAYETDPDTFPALTATVTASVFLSPKAEGVTAGATPAGPEAAAPAAAPVSTASTDSTAPTPTAAATP